MKLGLFSDPHYSQASVTCGVRQNSRSLEKMKIAYDRFIKAECDLVICLGDLTDTEPTYAAECENLKKLRDFFDAQPIPTTVVMGNHDAFVFEVDDFYARIGENRRPHPMCGEDISLLFIDACHFSSGVHYKPGDDDWTDTFFPHTDVLEKQLAESTGDVWVFLHQNLDPSLGEVYRLSNDAQIRRLFLENGRVRGVVCGHYHELCENTHDGIRYLTVRGMCEYEAEDAILILDI